MWFGPNQWALIFKKCIQAEPDDKSPGCQSYHSESSNTALDVRLAAIQVLFQIRFYGY